MTTLHELWARRQRSVHVYAEFTRAWVRLLIEVGFWGNLLGILLTVFASPGYARAGISAKYTVVSLVQGILIVVTLFFVRRHVRKFYAQVLMPTSDTESVIPLPSKMEAKLRPVLERVAEPIGLHTEAIKLFSDLDDYGDAPRMVESGGNVNIILPLGFGKVFRERSSVAEAMLAHELGHAAQRDTASWAYATAFMHILFRWMMPLTLLLSLITIIHASLAPEKIVTQTKLRDNYRTVWETKPNGSPEFRIVNEPDYETKVIWLPGEEKVAIAIVAPLSLLVGFFIIRRGRRASEEMADLAAIIVCGPYGLLQALEAVPQTSSSKGLFQFHWAGDEGHLLSIHPSRTARIAQVRRYASMPVGTRENSTLQEIGKVAPTSAVFPQIRRGLLILLSALIPFALGVGALLTINGSAQSSEQVAPTIVLWCISALTASFGLFRVTKGLLVRPITRVRAGGLIMISAIIIMAAAALFMLLLSLSTSYESLRFILEADWAAPAALLLFWTGGIVFTIGIVWMLIGLLGREFRDTT